MHGQWDKPRFRKLLADAMEADGLSQREVADLAGVSHSQVSRWMSGAHRPAYENVRRLGDALAAHGRDVTVPLLHAAGYDAGGSDIALELVESVAMSTDGPPQFDDPAEQQIAEQVWADNDRLASQPDLRRAFVALAVRMHREKKVRDRSEARRYRRA